MALSALLLHSTHFVVTLHAFLCNWIAGIVHLLTLKFIKPVLSGGDNPPVSKLPHHVGLVFVEDTINLAEVAKIVVWCVASGISCISVYDRAGFCKKSQLDLEKNITLEEQVRRRNVHKPSIISHHSTPHHLNGFRKSFQLRVLSVEEGRQSLVEVTRELSCAVLSRQLTVDDITPDTVQSRLQERLQLEDPQLVVRFGETPSLMGYLPWQCRLSEIMSCPSHIGVTDSQLTAILTDYCKTEQRFGK